MSPISSPRSAPGITTSRLPPAISPIAPFSRSSARDPERTRTAPTRCSDSTARWRSPIRLACTSRHDFVRTAGVGAGDPRSSSSTRRRRPVSDLLDAGLQLVGERHGLARIAADRLRLITASVLTSARPAAGRDSLRASISPRRSARIAALLSVADHRPRSAFILPSPGRAHFARSVIQLGRAGDAGSARDRPFNRHLERLSICASQTCACALRFDGSRKTVPRTLTCSVVHGFGI